MLPPPFETPSLGKYNTAIRALPFLPVYAPEHLLTDSFRLYRNTELEMFYAPFETINHSARMAIVISRVILAFLGENSDRPPQPSSGEEAPATASFTVLCPQR